MATFTNEPCPDAKAYNVGPSPTWLEEALGGRTSVLANNREAGDGGVRAAAKRLHEQGFANGVAGILCATCPLPKAEGPST